MLYNLQEAKQVFLEFFMDEDEEVARFFRVLSEVTLLKSSLFKEEFDDFCKHLANESDTRGAERALSNVGSLYALILDSCNSKVLREIKELKRILSIVEDNTETLVFLDTKSKVQQESPCRKFNGIWDLTEDLGLLRSSSSSKLPLIPNFKPMTKNQLETRRRTVFNSRRSHGKSAKKLEPLKIGLPRVGS